MLLLGDPFPNFSANSTVGEIDFYDWADNSWVILFSHPSDFTPVCTTELARVITLYPEFVKRNVKVIGLSCDNVSAHIQWCYDIKSYAGCNQDEKFPYPIIEDENRSIAMKLGMVDKDELDASGMPLSARAVYIIDPIKKFRLSFLYPATTGRNFDEILRVIDSLQLTDKAKVATPVDWKADVIAVWKTCMGRPYGLPESCDISLRVEFGVERQAAATAARVARWVMIAWYYRLYLKTKSPMYFLRE